ncbi:MAG: 50S ribosomal protein L4 [Patescibacteria group bacterium]
MAKVNLYNLEGTTIGDVELDNRLFEVKADEALVHEVVVAQAANSRVAIAHTKTRGEVAGSGIKPWKQKGTGRARHGSRRSPIWVGGGITFGPRNTRNFSKKINKKVRDKVLAMVLSDKVANENFIAVESFDLAQPKTKELFNALKSLPKSGKKTLLVLVSSDVSASRAARNIPKVSTIPANSINVIDLLSNERILVSKAAIDVIQKTFIKDGKKIQKKAKKVIKKDKK